MLSATNGDLNVSVVQRLELQLSEGHRTKDAEGSAAVAEPVSRTLRRLYVFFFATFSFSVLELPTSQTTKAEHLCTISGT